MPESVECKSQVRRKKLWHCGFKSLGEVAIFWQTAAIFLSKNMVLKISIFPFLSHKFQILYCRLKCGGSCLTPPTCHDVYWRKRFYRYSKATTRNDLAGSCATCTMTTKCHKTRQAIDSHCWQ